MERALLELRGRLETLERSDNTQSSAIAKQSSAIAKLASELKKLKAHASTFDAKLARVRAELSHPLESLVVGAICEEALPLLYRHEKGLWMTKFLPMFKPKEETWLELDLPKDLYDKLKRETVRNVRGV